MDNNIHLTNIKKSIDYYRSQNYSNEDILNSLKISFGKEVFKDFKNFIDVINLDYLEEELFVYKRDIFLKYSSDIKLDNIYRYCLNNNKLDIIKNFIKHYNRQNIYFQDYSIINYDILEIFTSKKILQETLINLKKQRNRSYLFNMYKKDREKFEKYIKDIYNEETYNIVMFINFIIDNDYKSFEIFKNDNDFFNNQIKFNKHISDSLIIIFDNSNKIDIGFISFFYSLANSLYCSKITDKIYQRIFNNIDELFYLIDNNKNFLDIFNNSLIIDENKLKSNIDNIKFLALFNLFSEKVFIYLQDNNMLNYYKDFIKIYNNILNSINSDKYKYIFFKLIKNSIENIDNKELKKVIER